jgi:hypothetical protein
MHAVIKPEGKDGMNIVVARQEGSSAYYSATDQTIFNLLDVARDIFNNHLAGVQNILREIRLDRPKKGGASDAPPFFSACICKHSQTRSCLIPYNACRFSRGRII